MHQLIEMLHQLDHQLDRQPVGSKNPCVDGVFGAFAAEKKGKRMNGIPSLLLPVFQRFLFVCLEMISVMFFLKPAVWMRRNLSVLCLSTWGLFLKNWYIMFMFVKM